MYFLNEFEDFIFLIEVKLKFSVHFLGQDRRTSYFPNFTLYLWLKTQYILRSENQINNVSGTSIYVKIQNGWVLQWDCERVIVKVTVGLHTALKINLNTPAINLNVWLQHIFISIQIMILWPLFFLIAKKFKIWLWSAVPPPPPLEDKSQLCDASFWIYRLEEKKSTLKKL